MAQVSIKVPSVGESITEATVGKWNFKTGDWVEKDAVVFELETEKATMEVTAPESGLLTIIVNSGTIVPIGTLAGQIETSAAKPAGASAASAPAAKGPAASATSAKPSLSTEAPRPSTPASSSAGSSSAGLNTVSEDALRGLGPSKRKAIREGRASLPSAPTSGGNVAAVPQAGEERVRMTTIRKKIAERLLFSQQSTATLTTFNEVDMTNLLKIRAEVQERFQKAHGVKLGFMSFFAKAMVAASAQVRVVNARLEQDDVVYNQHVHLGVAVSTDRGLVVPVLRFTDQLSYADIEKGVALLAEKARTGKLGLEEMMGGTITLTNGGIFGSLLSTPILNPPQSGILGMHKVEHRPMAVQDTAGAWKIEVRPMMYIALSYDHRLIDGRDSVTFLVKVKEYLEQVTAEEVLKG